MMFRAIHRSSDPLLSSSRTHAAGHRVRRATMRQNLVDALYTVAGLGLFFGVWW